VLRRCRFSGSSLGFHSFAASCFLGLSLQVPFSFRCGWWFLGPKFIPIYLLFYWRVVLMRATVLGPTNFSFFFILLVFAFTFLFFFFGLLLFL